MLVQIVAVAAVVAEPIALQQSDRLRARLGDEDLGRIDTVDDGAEVVLDRFGRRLVIPPARDMRLSEPATEQRKVAARETAKGDARRRVGSGARYSTFAPESLTTLAHLAISARW